MVTRMTPAVEPSGLDEAAIEEMEQFVHDYLEASVAIGDDGSRMRWYPWHSARYRFSHTLNVAALGRRIAEAVDADPAVVQVAALFHDVAKLEADQATHADEGARVAREYLKTHVDVPSSFVDAICDVVANHGHDGPIDALDPETRTMIEADALDKIGANGALLMLLRVGYEVRTHLDAAEMVDRIVDRGDSVAERVHSEPARRIAERRQTRARWIRDWLADEVVEMSP